jgi:glycosyltransferase involved in cell wall biosynthesis
MLRPLLSRAKRLIAASEFEAELFAGRLRLRRERFVVIPSGVELPPAPAPDALTDAQLVVSLGRLESYKGHQRVMRAVAALRSRRPDVRLRIVGTGTYEGQLRALAERLSVSDIVEIASVPPDDRTEMARLLWRARVVASLSEYESQGLAMQEALALGRPLVVSRGSALGELQQYPNVRAVDERAATSDVAAAIIEMLDAPAVEPPAMPTWQQCVDRLLELYREICSDRAGTPGP